MCSLTPVNLSRLCKFTMATFPSLIKPTRQTQRDTGDEVNRSTKSNNPSLVPVQLLLTLTTCLKTSANTDLTNGSLLFPLPRYGQLQPSSTRPTRCCSQRTLSLLTQTQQSAAGFSSTHTHIHTRSKWFTTSFTLSKNTHMTQATTCYTVMHAVWFEQWPSHWGGLSTHRTT